MRKETKVLNSVHITPLGDRVTTKLYSDRFGGACEDITLEMAVPPSFEFEGEKKRFTKQDKQKNWPSGGGK